MTRPLHPPPHPRALPAPRVSAGARLPDLTVQARRRLRGGPAAGEGGEGALPDPQVSAPGAGGGWGRRREPRPLRRKLEKPVALGENSAGPGWPRAVVGWQWVRAGPSTQAGRSGIESDKVIELINKIVRVHTRSKLSGAPATETQRALLLSPVCRFSPLQQRSGSQALGTDGPGFPPGSATSYSPVLLASVFSYRVYLGFLLILIFLYAMKLRTWLLVMAPNSSDVHLKLSDEWWKALRFGSRAARPGASICSQKRGAGRAVAPDLAFCQLRAVWPFWSLPVRVFYYLGVNRD